MATGGDGSNVAVFGGGCFWCTEAVFKDLKGVERVVPAYSGGTVPHPSYELVCTGTTGHAEVVEIRFDPAEISYRDLLEIFFATHDPTTPDRQGDDIGTQYRSVIYYTDERQREEAEAIIREMASEDLFGAPIVTRVEPVGEVYEAEAYHRDYYARNPNQGYCAAVIGPKVAKFRRKYADRLRQPA